MSNILNQKFLKIIEKLNNKKTDKKNLRILDWGCGKGDLVKFLNNNGYDCYGLEVVDNKKAKDQLELYENELLKDKIFYIKHDNMTRFTPNFFDIVITNQVLEHMSNKIDFINELKRILKTGGFSYNILPAKFRFFEVHLKMPFVHWVPKNGLRKFLIIFFNIFKINHWSECKNLSFFQQAQYYFDYSVNKTFYLGANDLFNVFKKNGFYVNESRSKNKIFNNIFIQFLKNNFISIEFLATKK